MSTTKIPLETMSSTKSNLDMEHNVKSAPPLRLRLEWSSVKLEKSIKEGPFFKSKVTKKVILNGVSGVAEPGELLSIMGPSGGGKTSLLNSLSRRAKITGGTVTLNGQKIPKNFNKISAYVMQDDRLFEVLTPRELFQFSANLRLPRDMNSAQRLQMVEMVINKLKMTGCANTRVGGRLQRGLSGGERKRTAIGVELITNPSLLFLDEPTSGLDSFTALSLIQTLKDLASEGHTVICTIHQPSSEIFALFDKLNLLVKGEVAFFGRPTDSIEFFGKLGHPCPTYTNPADFFMTLLQTQSDEEKERAVKIVAASKEVTAALVLANESVKVEENDLEPIESPERPPFWVQLLELTKRSWMVLTRNPLTFHARVIQFVLISLIVGCIYYKLGYTNADTNNRAGALFFLAMGPVMSSLNAVLLTFPLERALLIREQTNGMYGVASYFLGKTISALPLDIFFPTLISVLPYWMVGFNTLQASRFFLHWVVVVGLCFCASSMGLFLGSMLPNPEIAVSTAPVLVIPFMLFAGFYIKIENIPIWLRWLQYLSVFKWGFQGLAANEFHDTPYNCTDSEFVSVEAHGENILVCPITNGNQVLDNMNLSYPYDYQLALGVIFALAAGFRILSFFFLQYQTAKGVKKDQ